jgi:hypothetical protein
VELAVISICFGSVLGAVPQTDIVSYSVNEALSSTPEHIAVFLGPESRGTHHHILLSQIRSWRKLLNEELHDLYSSPSIIRMIKSRGVRLAGYVERMVQKREAYRMLVVKPEGKRPLGRPRRRWVDNVREIG